MKAWRRGLGAVACMGLVAGASAQPAAPAPPFELAYRAWDLVTELARHNGDPRISGECGKTFRPFVSPGLRMQSRQDQDVAAAACVAAARAACRDDKLRRAPDTAAKCGEFR
ncbi:MAG: hypothetical protein ACO1PB_07365 [Ramlibacter sp.]